jgi:hypothetical protein
VARDGDGENGLYTEELLRVLDSPGLKVAEVFKQVRRRVARRTENKQIPWESSSLIGDFVFNYQSPTPNAGSGQRREDVVFWESIEDSHNPHVYRAYLDQFPTGVFAALAKLRIDQLESAIVARATKSPPATIMDGATNDGIAPNASAAPPDNQQGKSRVALAPSTTTSAVSTPSLVKDQYQVALLPAQGKRWCSGVFDPSDVDHDLVRALNARKEFAAAYYPYGSWNSYGGRLGKGALWELDG